MSVQVMSLVWKSSQHSGSALLMELAIADFSDDDGRAYPSVATLARKCRIKPRNANYLLRQLQDSGELTVRIGEGPKGCNLYKINVKGLQSGAGVQGIAGVQPVAGGAAILCAQPLQPSAAKPSLNHQEPSDLRKSKIPACPFDKVIAAYHDKLPELPKVRLLTDKRKKALSKFWTFVLTSKKSDGSPRAGNQAEALTWIGEYFSRASHNDFLMGRAGRTAEHKDWQCDIDFLLTERGLTQVIEKTREAS